MFHRRFGALIAALAIAAIPAIGNAADDVAAAPAVPGMTGPTIDAQAQANALQDVPPNSWAYQAVVQLVNDGIIVGYPDGTFKGNRPLTRYEAAVMVERAVDYLTQKLSNPVTAVSVQPSDIAALRRLLDEFRGDIASLNTKVAALDTRLKKVETAQATDEAAAKRAQVHLFYFIRPGSFSDSVSAYAGDNRPLLTNTNVATSGGGGYSPVGKGGNVSNNSYLTGLNSQGYGYQLLRVLVDGTLDSRNSYHVRLENVYNWSTPDTYVAGGGINGGNATESPSFGQALGGYPRNNGIRLNYAYYQYNDPSGFTWSLGRINDSDSSLGLGWADQFNGAEVGFNTNPVNVKLGYFWDYSGNASADTACVTATNAAPLAAAGTKQSGYPCGVQSSTIMADVSGSPIPGLTVGASYMNDINDVISGWNPSACYNYGGTGAITPCSPAAIAAACPALAANPGSACNPYGLYLPTTTNLAVGTIYARYAQRWFSIEAEGLTRFGSDPWTGTAWTQAQAGWVQAKVGNYNPTPGSGYIEGGFIQAGLNSTNMHNGIVQGPFYEGQFLGDPNGYRFAYVGVHYWLGQFARVGLIYNAYNIIPGTTYPVASATCPGCYINNDIGQAVFLQTQVQF